MRGLCQGRAEGKTAGKKRVVVEGRPDVFEGVGDSRSEKITDKVTLGALSGAGAAATRVVIGGLTFDGHSLGVPTAPWLWGFSSEEGDWFL